LRKGRDFFSNKTQEKFSALRKKREIFHDRKTAYPTLGYVDMIVQRWASTDFFEYEYEYEYRPLEYEYEYEYWPLEYEYEYIKNYIQDENFKWDYREICIQYRYSIIIEYVQVCFYIRF